MYFQPRHRGSVRPFFHRSRNFQTGSIKVASVTWSCVSSLDLLLWMIFHKHDFQVCFGMSMTRIYIYIQHGHYCKPPSRFLGRFVSVDTGEHDARWLWCKNHVVNLIYVYLYIYVSRCVTNSLPPGCFQVCLVKNITVIRIPESRSHHKLKGESRASRAGNRQLLDKGMYGGSTKIVTC